MVGRDNWNVDAQRWMIRSDLFVKNILNMNLIETHQSYHPGVVLMWLSGFSKLSFYSLFEKVAGYSPKLSSGHVYPEQFYMASFFAVFPLVLLISLLFVYSLWMLKKVGLPLKYIYIFALILSFEPYLLGVTKFMHLTGIETALIFSAFCTTVYAVQSRKFKYYILVGIFIGMGFLTKSSALIFLPYISIIHLIYINKSISIKDSIMSLMKAYLVICSFAILVIFILHPAMWINPVYVIQDIFLTGVEGKGFVDGPHKSILGNKYTYYYEILFVKLLGLTIISYIFALYTIFKEPNKIIKNLFLSASLFIPYYFFLMSIPSKEMTRYVVVAIPFFLFCSAYSFYRISNTTIYSKYKYPILLLLVTYYIAVMYSIYPNFSTFHTELLGGYSGYSKLNKPYNDGEHYLQVGDYANLYLGDDARQSALVTPGGNKDVSARFPFLGETFSSSPDKTKKYKRVLYAVMYDETGKLPDSSCKYITGFGHRWPDYFEFVKLYDCSD